MLSFLIISDEKVINNFIVIILILVTLTFFI